MSLNSKDNQSAKRAPQAKDKANMVEQGFKAKKFSEKVRKEKKKKSRQRLGKRPNPVTKANATLAATGGERQKNRRRFEVSPKSSAIVSTKRVTIPPIVPSQKTICSLGNLHVGNC